MSGDLISRSALMEDFRNTITENSDTFDWLNMISKQPIAYNVEKVIKEIKELPTHTFETYLHGYPMDENFIDPCDVIKIVKSGGVAND